MPIFKVTLAREVIESIDLYVEADNLHDLFGPSPTAFYDQIIQKKKPSDWHADVNDVWLQEETESRKKQPELIVQRNSEGDFVVKQYVDARQTEMFPEKEEKKNA